ncbi:MAG TPA: nitrous oxide reductase family maturation protein NosD [Blastocatellia bacterium]|nr:nitrous oxide reductase family maturation protein NosD [Blastocatellia bacterium]
MKRLIQPKALLIWLTLAGSANAASGETLIVGGPDAQFQSVQGAIAAARAGDRIEVRGGVYEGNIVLDKRLTLEGVTVEGVGRPVLRGAGRGSVVVVTADGCVVRGFRIEHSGGDLTREDSAILLKSGNNQVEDNELGDVLYGIYLLGSSGNTLGRNVIRGRSELESGERGAGLHLWNSHGNTIEENVISFMRDGMYIQNCTDNRILRNRVFDLRYGLHYMNSDRNVFEDNFFTNNVAGAAIMYSNKIELRRNAFIRNRGFSSFGILFQDCNDLLAEENFIIDNATGIFIESLRRSVLRRNVIAENDVAIQMFSSADANVFTENNFVANLSLLQLVGRGSTTKWALDGRGNFWSNYDGYDLDGDGTGDVAHKVQNVFEHMEGNYPRLRIYLNSPAAQALAVAEKSFPVLRGTSEADASPLTRAVDLNFPFERERPTLRAQLSLVAISLVMIGLALVVMWKGQRRARMNSDRNESAMIRLE